MRKLSKEKKRDIEAVKFRWEFLRRNKQYIQDWKELQIVLKDKDNFKTLSEELSIDFTEPSEEELVTEQARLPKDMRLPRAQLEVVDGPSYHHPRLLLL